MICGNKAGGLFLHTPTQNGPLRLFCLKNSKIYFEELSYYTHVLHVPLPPYLQLVRPPPRQAKVLGRCAREPP